MHQHEFKLQLSGARVKHLTTPNQHKTFYLKKPHMTLQITLASSYNHTILLAFFNLRQKVYIYIYIYIYIYEVKFTVLK